MTRQSVICAFAVAAYCGILLHLTLSVAGSPAWNLDGMFYSACILKRTGPGDDPHERVYSDIEHFVPAPEAAALLTGSKYRRRLKADAELFALQLPFYEAKPLYIWAGQLATFMGAEPIKAPYAVSVFCYLLIGLCVPLAAVALGVSLTFALPLSLALMASPQVREVCELATPDALCALCLLCGTILTQKRFAAAIAFFTLALLARSDSLLFALCIVGARVVLERNARALAFCGLIALLMFAWAVLRVVDSYGWAVVMRHTFVSALDTPEELEQRFGLADYGRALVKGVRGHGTTHIANFLPFLVPGVVSIYLWGKHQSAVWHASAVYLGALWLGASAHFLAFPMLADRFFLPAYVATVPLMLALLAIRYEFARSRDGWVCASFKGRHR